jgi:hypothetical protein
LRFPSALDVALYKIINHRLHSLREHIKDYKQLGGRRSSVQRYEELPRAGTAVSNKVSSDLKLKGFEAKAISQPPK